MELIGGMRDVLLVVDIEEVTVEDSLEQTRDPSDPVSVALGDVAVDPVEEVEASVGAECKQVVGGDGLCLACALQHEQLGQNRNGLEPNRKRPKYLSHMSKRIINRPVACSMSLLPDNPALTSITVYS